MAETLREKLLSEMHLFGCQAQSNGYNAATNGEKEINLDFIDRHEEQMVDSLVALITSEKIQMLERLDEAIYDDGRVTWGDPTPESEEQWGKNHADLVLPTRYIHKLIESELQKLKEEK